MVGEMGGTYRNLDGILLTDARSTIRKWTGDFEKPVTGPDVKLAVVWTQLKVSVHVNR